jgi:hypothetical protein
MRTLSPYLFAFLILLMFAGCEKEEALMDPDPDPDPTLSQIQTSIFDTNCALSGCHAGATPQMGMNLSAGLAFSNIVNVPSMENGALNRVTPGDADNSYLYQKITGAAGITGSRMPLGRAALSQAQLDLVRDWIEAGAENN